MNYTSLLFTSLLFTSQTVLSFNDLFNFRQFLAYRFAFAGYEVEKNEFVFERKGSL